MKPDHITETQDFEDKRMELWDENIDDIHGYLLEGIVERGDEDLRNLAHWIKNNQNGTHTEAIGAAITKWVIDYTEPSVDDVMQKYELEPNDE